MSARLTQAQREKIRETLNSKSHPLVCTAYLRKIVGVPTKYNDAIRHFMAREVKFGNVLQLGKGKFWWQAVNSDPKQPNGDDLTFLIVGDTYNFRNELRKLGLSWNRVLKKWSTTDEDLAKKAQEISIELSYEPIAGIKPTKGRTPRKKARPRGTLGPFEGDEEELTDETKKNSFDLTTEALLDRMTVIKDCLVELKDENETLQAKIEELEATKPKVIMLNRGPKLKPKKVGEGHFHPIFEDVMFHIGCGDNVMLVGPKGCGKSYLARQCADALELDYGFLSLSGGVTENKLFGRSVPNITTGENKFHLAPFSMMFKKGKSLFLLDEIDGGDPNVLLSLNSALVNDMLSVDDDGTECFVKRGKNQVIMAAANTWSTGANRKYCGRNQQDSAFIERFVQLEMDYDPALEFSLCPGNNTMVRHFQEYRDNMKKNKQERELSTRFIERCHNWMLAGKNIQYCEKMLFGGWREDEVLKTVRG